MMKKQTLFLLLVVLLMTLAELSEGRRRWRQRRRHGLQGDRRHGGGVARREDGHGRRRSHGRPPWLDRLGERFGFRRPHRHHSFDLYHPETMNPRLSFDFLWGPGGVEEEPWWMGPNVCESEEEQMINSTETGDFVRHFSKTSRTCDESETAYRCKETTETPEGRREVVLVQECCHGFTRKEGEFGCPQKLEMKNLLEKAQDLGLSDFVRVMKMLSLEREMQEGNFTVFAPVNGAFGLDSELIDSDNNVLIQDQPHVIMMSKPSAERAVEGLQDAVLGHMVFGSVRTSAMEDEELLDTASPQGSTIRINYFVTPKKVQTANCVPFESSDHMASNGIIHTLKRAMRPVTKSFLDVVRSSPELSTLKTVLAAANYVSKLDQDGQMTLLAPTNQAFEMMDPRLRERLLRGDKKCLEKVLLNHLLPNVICTAALQGQAKTRNQLGHYVNLTKTEDEKIFVEGAQIVQEDLMTTNGVIHIIDSVLVPEEALDVLEVLRKEGFTELLGLLDRAGLTKAIDTAENITLFAPTNDAIQKLPETVRSKLTSNPAELAEVLRFHVSPTVRECSRFQDNELIPSLEGKEIRLNHFHTFGMFSNFHHHSMKTAQCVPMTHKHMDACNGRITVVEDLLRPPQGNVVDVLALDKRFSTLLSLVKRSGLADALQEDGPFTVFAPNNEAFEMIDSRTLDELANDGERLKRLLKRHVFGNTLCCAGIFQGTWFGDPQVRTLSGDLLRLDRERDGTLRVGRSEVVNCDQTASNGNVIEIDTVLMEEPPRRWRSWWDHFEP